MTKMKIYIMALAAMTSAVATETASAQNQQQDSSMVQSVRLARDYSPIVQQKNKIDRQPALQSVQQKKNDATYADWSVDPVRSAEIGIVPAGQVIASKKDDWHVGYVELSAGNYWNADLKAGISSGDFRIDGKGYFTKGDIELPFSVVTADGVKTEDWTSRRLNGSVVGTYSHTLYNDAQLEAHVALAGTSVNTFNYRFYEAPDTFLLQKVVDKPNHQHWGQVRGDASYETDQLRLFLGYDFTHLTTPDSLPCDGWHTNTLQFSGRYGWYENENCQFSIDLDMGGVFGKSRSYFTMHPTMHLSVIPEADTWRRIYFDLGFGSRHTPLMQLMEAMPIAYIEKEYKNSSDAFNLHIGYEDNEQGYFRWGAELQLGYVKNDLGAVITPIDSIHKDGLYAKIVQEDCFNFGLNAHLDYEYNRYFGAKVNFNMLTHSCETHGLGNPPVNIGMHALSHPGNVAIDFGLDLEFGHKMYYNGDLYDLNSNADLNFRVDWQCNEDWQLFAFGRNMLNLENEFYPGIPAQRLNLHFGFNWKF